MGVSRDPAFIPRTSSDESSSSAFMVSMFFSVGHLNTGAKASGGFVYPSMYWVRCPPPPSPPALPTLSF